MSGILPKEGNERLSWSINFEAEFPALAVGLGFINTETASLLADSAAMRFAILNAQAGAAFSKACTAYKNDLLGGVGENQQTPEVPSFTPTPSPPSPVDAGIIERLSRAMNRAKLSAGYTQTIGETLQIATAPPDSAIPTAAKPAAAGTALTGSSVRIEWTKGRFDGVYIDSQRGDETDWTRLDFDMRSPFEDTRPPLAAGKPEERRYRLRYFVDNKEVGVWSDTINVITLP